MKKPRIRLKRRRLTLLCIAFLTLFVVYVGFQFLLSKNSDYVLAIPTGAPYVFLFFYVVISGLVAAFFDQKIEWIPRSS